MGNDNPGNFFDAENFDDSESGRENLKPVKLYGKQLFKKTINILNLSQTICDVLPERKHSEVTWSLVMGNTNTYNGCGRRL